MTTPTPCPCGCPRPPVERRAGSRSYLRRLVCPGCGLATPCQRPERLAGAWEEAVAEERARLTADDELREMACGDCGGDGVHEGRPYGYDPRNGELLQHTYTCKTCGGSGHEMVELQVPTEAEIMEEMAHG